MVLHNAQSKTSTFTEMALNNLHLYADIQYIIQLEHYDRWFWINKKLSCLDLNRVKFNKKYKFSSMLLFVKILFTVTCEYLFIHYDAHSFIK